MDKLQSTIAYILKEYPYKSELSKTRVTKLVYLADWKHAITEGKQITEITWYFDHYGPYVSDVHDTVRHSPDIFTIENTYNPYGNNKLLFSLTNEQLKINLTKQERASVDHIITHTSKLNWSDFIKLVYSTYPIMNSKRYSSLDLTDFADKYSVAKN